jgi:tetratricopeptide (TPR) repeat protein
MVANNEMGIAEMMMGQTYKAKELFEIALDQASRFRDASETAKSIYLLASANLGLAQWTDGQYEEASHTLLQAWNYHEELTRAGENTSFAQVAPTYPIDYANLSRPGRIAHAIGNVKDSQNCEDKSDNGKEALGWYKQAYEHYEKTIGKYHHRSADVCHKLAMKYIELGDFGQARYVLEAIDYITHTNCDKAIALAKPSKSSRLGTITDPNAREPKILKVS